MGLKRTDISFSELDFPAAAFDDFIEHLAEIRCPTPSSATMITRIIDLLYDKKNEILEDL